jgi:hypothetical protein
MPIFALRRIPAAVAKERLDKLATPYPLIIYLDKFNLASNFNGNDGAADEVLINRREPCQWPQRHASR